MRDITHLIIGGGVAGTTAAEVLRALEPTASIAIVSDEPYPLYSRIAVSKENYLLEKISEAQVLMKDEAWYAQHRIELLENAKALSLDAHTKTVQLSTGEALHYEKLLLAVGATPRRWTIPGADKAGIHYVRTFDDGKGLLEAFRTKKQALFVGGGFISFELAHIAVKRGIAATVLIREPYFWQIALDEDSGRIIEDVLEKNGVRIVRGALAVEVLPHQEDAGRVGGVKTDTGETIPADFIAVAIGLVDALDPFRPSGLAVEHGILANEYLETNLQDVWTAGDCAEFQDLVLQERVMMGNWVNASMQGRVAAANMAGKKTPFKLLSSYPTMSLGLSVCFIGDVRRLPSRAYISRGSRSEGRRVSLILEGSRIEGATLVNANTDLPWVTKLIASGIEVTPELREKLGDAGIPFKDLALAPSQKI